MPFNFIMTRRMKLETKLKKVTKLVVLAVSIVGVIGSLRIVAV